MKLQNIKYAGCVAAIAGGWAILLNTVLGYIKYVNSYGILLILTLMAAAFLSAWASVVYTPKATKMQRIVNLLMLSVVVSFVLMVCFLKFSFVDVLFILPYFVPIWLCLSVPPAILTAFILKAPPEKEDEDNGSE
ncbi:hypothetical protein [Prevotella sp. kh1p2]|uniref:hypothetical protein n=1 Tax=Prevotella sp. kh1p2 TaxID=1761883 RepID=UPI0008CBE059|nr:hypothetical protein [Prevotella sp. kh1p2]SES88251.1 hypothetical protein SAMN04487825_1076 [Prevotella sp. kh1p2]SNU12524.1 hypothetical protein SAMN06298210_1307 [Prevotellaceae bacterium KH2P17]